MRLSTKALLLTAVLIGTGAGGGARAATVTLTDADGLDYDIEYSSEDGYWPSESFGGGEIQDGYSDATDSWPGLCVTLDQGLTGDCAADEAYWDGGSYTLITGDREVVLPEQELQGVAVQRRVYVPEDGPDPGRNFARFLDTFRNDGGETITFKVRFGSLTSDEDDHRNDLGSDVWTQVIASSDGDTDFDLDDLWVVTDDAFDSHPAADPSLLHVIQGAGAAETIDAGGLDFFGSDLSEVAWEYEDLTLEPGDGFSILTLVGQEVQRAEAEAEAGYLGSGPVEMLAGMSDDEIYAVVNWALCGIHDDDGDGFTECEGDCDDADATRYPGADETCNGVDDDCDGDVDEDDAIDVLTWYLDGDGDGYGDPASSDIDCDQPADHVGNADDCDDGDAAQHPGADEFCNGEDDDCDGEVDEDDAVDAQTWYEDGDGDGYGDPVSTEVDCVQPVDHVGNADDCDDSNPDTYPGADEFCNGEDDDCDGEVDEDDAVDVLTWYEDGDGDGYGDPATVDVDCDQPADHVGNADDCDDGDAAQFPGAVEFCNGEDDDCDGEVDEDDAVDAATWYLDADGDGFGDPAAPTQACSVPADHVADATDCDDVDPAVNPAAEEVCNGIDDDCDALTDELGDGDGDGFSICGGDCDDVDPDVNPDAEEVCDGIDNDCDPDTDELVDADGDTYAICDDDCDDGEVAMFPGNPEVCDGLDNDCDGALPGDEMDDDGDGMTGCEGDCDDADDLTYDGAPEQCDGVDNDCDEIVDEDVDEDLDGDGFNACQGDCDNEEPNVFPGADEVCDGVDSDCDGILPDDEQDGDGDGWLLCEDDCDDGDPDLNLDDVDGDGYSTCDDPEDCDDGDETVYPGAAEICDDGVDNDCDGLTDDEQDGCDDPADDDDDDDDDDSDTSDDDDDLNVGGGCECEGNQARTGSPGAGAVILATLATVVMGRRRR